MGSAPANDRDPPPPKAGSLPDGRSPPTEVDGRFPDPLAPVEWDRHVAPASGPPDPANESPWVATGIPPAGTRGANTVPKTPQKWIRYRGSAIGLTPELPSGCAVAWPTPSSSPSYQSPLWIRGSVIAGQGLKWLAPKTLQGSNITGIL